MHLGFLHMPVILRVRGYRCWFYEADLDEPAHVHVGKLLGSRRRISVPVVRATVRVLEGVAPVVPIAVPDREEVRERGQDEPPAEFVDERNLAADDS